MRVVLALFLALTLAGCGGSSEREKALEKALEQQYGAVQARLEHAEHQAAIAQACDYVIQACPASMTAPGRRAIAAGASGGGLLFWGLVFAKFLALTLPAAIATGIAGWLWTRISAPALAEADAARKMVADAEARAAAARAAAESWEARARAARAAADEAEQARQQAEAAAEAVQAELERLQEARKLLSGL